MRGRFLFVLLSGIIILSSCNPYQKQIPTGDPLALKNVYTSPGYNYDKLFNVLLLPINNPLKEQNISDNSEEIALAILRNFKQFHYFNFQYAQDERIKEQSAINLQTEQFNRTVIGMLGEEYNAQAIMQISITDLMVHPPMRIGVQAILVDAHTGERIWQASQVFDAKNADVYNGMRYWWNTHVAGANPFNRFDFDRLRPNTFFDYVFYTFADTYGAMRAKNIRDIARQKKLENKSPKI